MLFFVTKRLSQEEATRFYLSMLEWFNEHPKRRVCRTDINKIRKGHIKEDILFYCETGVTISGL